MKTIKVKGNVYFRMCTNKDNNLELMKTDKEKEIEIYDLFDGIDFLKQVEQGFITDYDGILSEVIVDDYISNIGLAEENLCQGEFLVSGDVFFMLCLAHDIKVNWANK